MKIRKLKKFRISGASPLSVGIIKYSDKLLFFKVEGVFLFMDLQIKGQGNVFGNDFLTGRVPG
jgi:hypothetical protein